jgi:hypothetical protein
MALKENPEGIMVGNINFRGRGSSKISGWPGWRASLDRSGI